MAAKLMVFIDGSWLYFNRARMKDAFKDPDYQIDYKKLPKVVASRLSQDLGMDVDIIRTHFFGSIPINRDGFDPGPQERFYDYLEKQCLYDMEIYDMDFGKLYRPKEKCVDVALATCMLYYAAIPDAYDVGALIAGDLDYKPLLRRVRALGKRTILVAAKAIGNYYPTSPALLEDYSLFDFDVLFLDDVVNEIRYERVAQIRRCEGCGGQERTTWEGSPFFCSECKKEHARKRAPIERVCETCGKKEKTTWKDELFYCNDCRAKFRESKK